MQPHHVLEVSEVLNALLMRLILGEMGNGRWAAKLSQLVRVGNSDNNICALHQIDRSPNVSIGLPRKDDPNLPRPIVVMVGGQQCQVADILPSLRFSSNGTFYHSESNVELDCGSWVVGGEF